MKKVLIATTALIATASVAAADVRISGYGRFGLSYAENNDLTRLANGLYGAANGLNTTNITSRLRLQFDMSAETDSGVAFGARFRAQAESRNNNPGTATFNGARFFVTYEGLSVGVGNIIGAVENMPGLYLETRTAGTGIDGAGFWSNVGNVNNEFFNWDAYSSAGAGVNGVEVLYTAGGFTGHVSYSARNNSTINPLVPNGGPNGAARTAVMATYTWGDWTASAAYQSSDFQWEDKAVVAIMGDLGMWGFRIAYADNDGIGKWGLYGNVDIGAASNLVAWVTQEDAVSAADVAAGRADNRDGSIGGACATTCTGTEGTSYGLNYSYDLGGGASFEAGYRHASMDQDAFQAGVYFSF